MFALMLSTVLLAATPVAPVGGAPVGYSAATTQLLEKFDTDSYRPVRERRPVSIGAEVGFNGLGGLGLNVGYNLTPHWSLDAGGGFGLPGARLGVRGRYNFLTSNWTPFVGLGVNYLIAMDRSIEATRDMQQSAVDALSQHGQQHNVKATYHVQSAPFGSAMLGMSYQARNGFSMLAGLGWSQLLDRSSNVVITQGSLNKSERRALDLLVGSGPIASATFGYSF